MINERVFKVKKVVAAIALVVILCGSLCSCDFRSLERVDLGNLYESVFCKLENVADGEFIEAFVAPDGEHTFNTYLIKGNTYITEDCVRGELEDKDGNLVDIYYRFKESAAKVKWVDNENIMVSGTLLNIFGDTYDFRTEDRSAYKHMQVGSKSVETKKGYYVRLPNDFVLNIGEKNGDVRKVYNPNSLDFLVNTKTAFTGNIVFYSYDNDYIYIGYNDDKNVRKFLSIKQSDFTVKDFTSKEDFKKAYNLVDTEFVYIR